MINNISYDTMSVNMKDRPHSALTSAQIRAARALLRWRAEDLAENSTVGVATVRRAELAEGATSMTAANDAAVRRALEAAGVEFIDQNGGGAGVRLRKSAPTKKAK
jgi:transcriptional regulator with XRE-family HTH domain